MVLGKIGGIILDSELNEVNSTDLKEMYEKNKAMKDYLEKEYKKLRGSDE